MPAFEKVFEKILWNSRFIVLFAVVSSLAAAIVLFLIATSDVFSVVRHALHYTAAYVSGAETNYDEFHAETIGHIIGAVDDFLLATVLFIFSLGLYELFISKIDEAEGKSNVLLIKTLDDLKDRLAKVVLMILIVTFFKNVLHVSFDNPLNIIYLGGGIFFVALALYLTHASGKSHV